MISPIHHHATTYGFRMPTPAESRRNDIELAKSAMARGTARKLPHAPAGTPTLLADITAKGTMGAKVEAYRVGAHVYVKTTPVVPHARATWYDAGMICY